MARSSTAFPFDNRKKGRARKNFLVETTTSLCPAGPVWGCMHTEGQNNPAVVLDFDGIRTGSLVKDERCTINL